MNKLESFSCNGPLARKCRAFTLIELLTVVAIIGLLISILLPSLGRARDAAKNVKTKAIMKTIGEGLEAFANDNEAELKGSTYPASTSDDDPTATGDELQIFGAQWLVRYLMGKDLNGYVSPKSVPKQFWNSTPGWAQKGWYSRPGDSDFPSGATEPFERAGPYVSPDNVKVKAPKDLPGFKTGDAKVDKEPIKSNLVIIDPFEMPILYYAANTREAARPNGSIATWNAKGAYPGVYCFSDNAIFTGGKGCYGTLCTPFEPWDFGAGKGPLTYPAAWETTDPNNPPNWRTQIANHPNSFPYYVMNKSVYDSTADPPQHTKTVVVPYRKDSFILMSPGKDGQFGTKDDITNFE